MYKLELTEEEIQFLYDRCSRKAQRLEEAGLHDKRNSKMKIKFITFRPLWEYRGNCNVCISPEVQINDWLKENPDIEIIC